MKWLDLSASALGLHRTLRHDLAEGILSAFALILVYIFTRLWERDLRIVVRDEGKTRDGHRGFLQRPYGRELISRCMTPCQIVSRREADLTLDKAKCVEDGDRGFCGDKSGS